MSNQLILTRGIKSTVCLSSNLAGFAWPFSQAVLWCLNGVILWGEGMQDSDS